MNAAERSELADVMTWEDEIESDSREIMNEEQIYWKDSSEPKTASEMENCEVVELSLDDFDELSPDDFAEMAAFDEELNKLSIQVAEEMDEEDDEEDYPDQGEEFINRDLAWSMLS